MANHAGKEGTVKVGGTPSVVAEVREWSIEERADTVEDTIMGDSWRTRKATLNSWSGSLKCFWDETDTNGQVTMTIGSSIDLKVYPEGDTTGDKFYSGAAIVTGINTLAALDGMVEADFSFEGNGALTISTV